jgi:hypothetical protein
MSRTQAYSSPSMVSRAVRCGSVLLYFASACLTGVILFLWFAGFKPPPRSVGDLFGNTPLAPGPSDEPFYYWMRNATRQGTDVDLKSADVYYVQSVRGQLVIGRMWGFCPVGRDIVDYEAWLRYLAIAPLHPGTHALPGGVVKFVFRPAPTSPLIPAMLAVSVPNWLAVLISASPVAVLLIRFRRTTRAGVRHRANLCSACGYNLTGNVSGVCPECGTPIVKEPHEIMQMEPATGDRRIFQSGPFDEPPLEPQEKPGNQIGG